MISLSLSVLQLFFSNVIKQTNKYCKIVVKPFTFCIFLHDATVPDPSTTDPLHCTFYIATQCYTFHLSYSQKGPPVQYLFVYDFKLK